MAAGQGFKTFVTGEVLTAGDVNGYLMQGINVFTNATARDAAILTPAEGQFAFTKDNNSLWYYDGAAWVASGATGDIEGVTAGVGISGGGTSGTVTVTNSMATAIDAKGDLVPGTGADTFARLAVGANDTVLTADSSTATGLKWATAAAGGMTLISETGATTLSSLSFSSLGSYKQLLLIWAGIRHSTTGSAFSIRFNNDSSSIYSINGFQGDTSFTLNGTSPDTIQGGNNITIFSFGQNVTNASANTDVNGSLLIDNYTSTTKSKYWEIKHTYYNASAVSYASLNAQGIFNTTSAITSIDIVRLSGSATFTNQNNTTIRLYGVS
jgi:hypothetical protein